LYGTPEASTIVKVGTACNRRVMRCSRSPTTSTIVLVLVVSCAKRVVVVAVLIASASFVTTRDYPLPLDGTKFRRRIQRTITQKR
jgi:hypothetical protein